MHDQKGGLIKPPCLIPRMCICQKIRLCIDRKILALFLSVGRLRTPILGISFLLQGTWPYTWFIPVGVRSFTRDDKTSTTIANKRNVHWGSVPPVCISLWRLEWKGETELPHRALAPYKKKYTYPPGLSVHVVFVSLPAERSKASIFLTISWIHKADSSKILVHAHAVNTRGYCITNNVIGAYALNVMVIHF